MFETRPDEVHGLYAQARMHTHTQNSHKINLEKVPKNDVDI